MNQISRTRKNSKTALKALGLVALLIVVVFGISEALGWAFLARPAERWLGQTLGRDVILTQTGKTGSEFRLRLLGGIRLDVKHLELDAPEWSQSPFMIQAENLTLKLRYKDLLAWRNRSENTLRIESLQADVLNGHIERLKDGRASWQFSRKTPEKEPGKIPDFGFLAVRSGSVLYNDEPFDLNLNASLTLQEGDAGGDALQIKASGKYQDQDLRMTLGSQGVLPWVAENSAPIPVSLNVTLGGAKLAFKGQSSDALKLQTLSGNFELSGKSLGAAGKALGVTLPDTPPFRTAGQLKRDTDRWSVSVTTAKVGSSSLKGDFVYQADQGKKLLTGVLEGSSLVLADLAPSVGAGNSEGASKKTRTGQAAGRVLPTKQFDLPSLRAMDADVRLDIQNLDLGSEALQPLRPLHARIELTDGVLRISELDATTAKGHVEGMLELDARGDVAQWDAKLKWDRIELAQWIKMPRADSKPPYITGSMNGEAVLQGKGRSTAEILGSMDGNIRTRIQNGTISHLLIEAAGLDAAETLGVWFRGDETLKMSCAVAQLRIKDGLVEPSVFVIDTQDSALWVNGHASMKTETLDLKLVVTPKDFSPVSLRTPLLITGTLASPDVSLQKGPLIGKVAGAALLSLVNPFAALLPFLDAGSTDSKADTNATGCHNLAARAKAQKAKARPD